MPDRDSSYLSAGGGGGSLGEEGGRGSGRWTACAGTLCANVCKRGKRCRFRHPDFSEVSDLGVQKNEFVFCHDHQNRECLRSSCRFVHGSKDDEDCYKRSGELPPRLRGKVAARLGLSPTDLPHSRGEVPLCRDFLKGECQRGSKCKFRHVKKDYEFEPAPRVGVGGAIGAGSGGGRRRLEGLRLVDATGGGHFELGVPAPLPPRPLEYRFLEEENCLLRKRVEELKKQVSNLLATNDVLLEQNAQYRSQAKVITLTSTPLPSDSLGPAVVSSYNHSIAQTHTTLSSAGLQPRVVTQQDLASSIAPPAPPPIAAPPAIAAPHLSAEITPLAAALVQTIAQGLGPPVSMASVAVSVAHATAGLTMSHATAGLAMSHATAGLTMSHATAGLTMSHATAPMVSYPIASQSMRITTLPH
uniref:C3H1-type domain-containing protein n=1 Tax=Gadus morhua TaxID=8049 RepID=A0A8C5CJR5_GADMO